MNSKYGAKILILNPFGKRFVFVSVRRRFILGKATFLREFEVANSLIKVFLSSIKRLLTLKRKNLFVNGVKFMIFASYFQFTHKSGFI